MASAEPLAPPSARELFERMRGKRILVVGDLMVDEWIWGNVSRISPEAPVPVVAVRDHTFTLGGAGNVVFNLHKLGAKVSVVGAVGDDTEGERVKQIFSELGVDAAGVIQLSGRPTTRKTRIVAHNQQVVRTDWERTEPLTPAANETLRGEVQKRAVIVDAVILSDYAKGLFTAEITQAAVSAPVIVADPKPINIDLFRNVTCLAPNASEAAQMTMNPEAAKGDPAALERSAKQLIERLGCKYVLITQGDQGMTLFGRTGEPLHVPVASSHGPRIMYDVSGAGDTVVAALTLSMAAKAPMQVAMQLANIAASVVVEKLGTATASPEEILANLEAGER